MRNLLLILVIGAISLLSREVASQTASDQRSISESSSATALPDYQIGDGDVLQVSVWGQPQLTRTVTVRPDGRISLPLVTDVSVSALTVAQARSLLQDKFSPYIKRPAVTVQVTEVHSKVVYVTGEVQRPGAYLMVNPTTVVQLVVRAGGVTDFAKTKRVYILRPPNGQRIPVNLKAALQGHHSNQDLPLSVGDTVVVP